MKGRGHVYTEKKQTGEDQLTGKPATIYTLYDNGEVAFRLICPLRKNWEESHVGRRQYERKVDEIIDRDSKEDGTIA